MLVHEALTRLIGMPRYVIMRPTGIMLTLTNHLRIVRLGRNGPGIWVPTISDLSALDWQVFSPEQMKQMGDAARAEALAEE